MTNVETFSFNGTDYTKAELETEAARQANTGPGQASVDTGGSVAENAAAGTVVATLTGGGCGRRRADLHDHGCGRHAGCDANFEIVGDEIRVKAGADVDFEAAASHDLHIVASDAFESAAPQG